jgi:hypothetical protein
LTALIGELSGSQRGGRSAVQEFCTSVLGVPISRGAIQRGVDRVSEAITPRYEAMAGKARSTKVNYIDETAWYQHGVLAWLWVMANPTVALFTVQVSRSKAAFERQRVRKVVIYWSWTLGWGTMPSDYIPAWVTCKPESFLNSRVARREHWMPQSSLSRPLGMTLKPMDER